MTKYVFVSGGVVSSLGKGIAAASLAAILESRGIKVTLLKLDPYINVDPGTMSPFQHGEVFVTEDGAETDLDLGHYERFQCARMRNGGTTSPPVRSTRASSRRSAGATTSAAPSRSSRTSPTRSRASSRAAAQGADVAIVEIGGTVGDIESLPFLEAVRQMRLELGQRNTCYIHLTLVPYIKSAGEIKTKPTQHSVKELREIGIQPDALLCRCGPADAGRGAAARSRSSPTSPVEAVISVWDVDSIYKIPCMLHQQMLDEIVCHKLDILARPADLSPWESWSYALEHPQHQVTIALVGKYVDLTESVQVAQRSR